MPSIRVGIRSPGNVIESCDVYTKCPGKYHTNTRSGHDHAITPPPGSSN